MHSYSYTDNGRIRRSDGAIIPVAPGNADYDRMVASGELIAPYVPPAPSVQDFRRAIQGMIESVASQKGYDSASSCAGYTTSSIPEWAAEAAAFVQWRDAVWVYVFAQMHAVETGQRANPSIEEILSEITPIQWPGEG